MKERAEGIVLLHSQLKAEYDGDERAGTHIVTLTSPSTPHANCARSFVRLFHFDQARADRVADMAWAFLESRSP